MVKCIFLAQQIQTFEISANRRESHFIPMDQAIPFLVSTAALLSALAALFSVRQNATQRRATYAVQLTIADTRFRGRHSEIATGASPRHWQIEGSDTIEGTYFPFFFVPILNLGLGAAKEVKLIWFFPIEAMVTDLTELAKKSSFDAKFDIDGDLLSIDSADLGDTRSVWGNQRKTSIDFILPVSVTSSRQELVLPNAYIELVSALLFLSMNSGVYGLEKIDIPSLRLDVSHVDVGGARHNTTFEITTAIEYICGGGTAFGGVIKAKTIS